MNFLTLPVVEDRADQTGWSDWSPTVSAATGSFGSTTINRAKYRVLGKVVEIEASVTVTTVGTASGDLRLSLPITGIVYPGDVGSSWLQGGVGYNQGNGNILQCMCISGNVILWTKTNGTPFAAGQTLNLKAFYEIP